MLSSNLNSEQSIRLQNKIFKLRKKARKKKVGKTRNRSLFCFSENKSMTCFSLLLRVFYSQGYISKSFEQKNISAPIKFSFNDSYDDCILFFKQVLSSFIFGQGNIVIDFSRCLHSEMSVFEVLNVIIKELYLFRSRYNNHLYKKIEKTIKCIPSLTDAKTNKYLHAFDYHSLDEKFNDGSSYLALDIISGRGKKEYKYNYKSMACAKIAGFIEESGGVLGVSMNYSARNALEGFLTEVLNNAEDHSVANSEWYVNGIAFNERQHGIDVIELHLSIMNIGPSMYEGFEATKVENVEMYRRLEELFEEHSKQLGFFKPFDKESLFMLYMLNEGISRIKYQDRSRGNGTMNFIESFISLGSFGEIDTRFAAKMNIVSGHGLLICDNKYKPFLQNSIKIISLNKEQDIHKLPDKNYLKTNKEYFPGTILECKIFLNKEYIFQQLETQANE